MSNYSNATVCHDAECLRHPHWDQFEEVPYGAHAAIGLVMTVISIASITGNSFVIYVYSK